MSGTRPSPVNEAFFLEVNGQPQWVTVRGADRDNPVLFVVGGPGACFSSMAMFFAPWEQVFTLVQWDQPGAGATYGKNAGQIPEPYCLERLSTDAVTAATMVRKQLGIDNMILLGMSAGTVTGLLAIHDPLQVFSAYIGCGSFVHWQRQAATGYDMVVSRARSAGCHPPERRRA